MISAAFVFWGTFWCHPVQWALTHSSLLVQILAHNMVLWRLLLFRLLPHTRSLCPTSPCDICARMTESRGTFHPSGYPFDGGCWTLVSFPDSGCQLEPSYILIQLRNSDNNTFQMGSGQGHLSLEEAPSVQCANVDTSSGYRCWVPSKSLKLLSPLLTQEWRSLLNLNLYN